MLWRRKNRESNTTLPAIPSSRIEVEVAKDATKEAKDTADKINEHVKDLLGENHFTIKIVLAAHNPSARRKESGA